ncbi:hypothetical protein V494_01795 [Pseudogymnoascus sp. VKM F-4513 (FW-928)]|nr:hypothetical protein V494_01795 [Pseudogymnoascus sp. VKM F-4513 (FW-928)]
MWNSGLILLAGLVASVVSEPIPSQARQTAAPTTATTTGGVTPKATSTVPSPVQEGIIDTCTDYYKALDGDDCWKITARFGFTLAEFIQWNPAVDKTCAGFWLGYYYCVAIPGRPTSTIATGPAPTATVIEGTSYPLPPSATGTGSTPKCNTWYVMKFGNTCDLITNQFGITKTQLNLWNSDIDINCSNLWAGNSLCISSPVDKSYWSPLGCYTDSSSRALTKQIIFPDQNTVMTPKLCQDACGAAGYKYAGVEYAHQCWCGNTIDNNHGPATSGCTAACPGEPLITCGGDDRLNIYQNEKYADLGCFSDSSTARTLRTQIIIPDQNSILTREICQNACDKEGFLYSGVEYAHQCWCDQQLHGALATGGCTSPCAGDASQMCGGSDRLNVMKKPQSRTMGCYPSPPLNKTLQYRVVIPNEETLMTPDLCRTTCRSKGFVYSGVESGSQCYCDDRINPDSTPGSGCIDACPGGTSMNCGGNYRITIHSL